MSIDDKLRQIRIIAVDFMTTKSLTTGLSEDNIAQIKQAFASEEQQVPIAGSKGMKVTDNADSQDKKIEHLKIANNSSAFAVTDMTSKLNEVIDVVNTLKAAKKASGLDA